MQKLKARTAGIVAWPVSIFLVAGHLLIMHSMAQVPSCATRSSTDSTRSSWIRKEILSGVIRSTRGSRSPARWMLAGPL